MSGAREDRAARGTALAEGTPGEGPAAVAELHDIDRTYVMGSEVVRALDRFSFTFRSGEYWSIVGSSGSGKSTLLNILGCLDRPTAGSYKVCGEEVADKDDDELSTLRNRYFGFVFQSYNLIPQLTVLENILVPLYYREDPPDDGEERALVLAERVGLGGRVRHRPQELSGGQQQRVAIARALINRPALLLADEATGNLDSQTAQEILGLFDEVHDSGMTILLVTHEPSVAARTENMLRLKDGRIFEVRRGRGQDARRFEAPELGAGVPGEPRAEG